MEDFTITPISHEDWEQIIELSDKNIGFNYTNRDDLSQFFGPKRHENELCSFVLKNKKGKVFGVRITFAPGHWPQDLYKKSLVDLWPLEPKNIAYFKTLIIDSEIQGKGWGPRLTKASLKSLKTMGAHAVICHCWKESPNNSSYKYLTKSGFQALGEIKNFWQNKDYKCVRCQPQPCSCTAIEMIKNI